MSDFKYSLDASFSLSDKGASSGNEADSEGEKIFDKDMKEMLSMTKTFNPYMYEPERDVSTCSDESDMSGFDKSESEECPEDNVRVRNLDWCKCGNCLVGKRVIDCLCCFEVHPLNSEFDTENISCIIQPKEFEMLCTSEIVLKNVLTGLQVTSGDHLEYHFSNQSLRYAVHKKFIWWVFKHLSKWNKRIIPLCELSKIREHFPEPDADYVNYYVNSLTKSTNHSKVKYIVYIIAKIIKQTNMKVFLI